MTICIITDHECPFADGGYCRAASIEEIRTCPALDEAALYWKGQHDDREQRMQDLRAKHRYRKERRFFLGGWRTD